VYAHNDEDGHRAIQALKAAGIRPGQDVILVSIDGEKDALKAIIAGELGASVECTPRFADKVFESSPPTAGASRSRPRSSRGPAVRHPQRRRADWQRI